MAWVLLDDNFNNHPKAIQAGPVACWLFCCGLMYCRKYHTDGFIPKAAVPMLGVSTNTKRLEAALVDVTLWEPVDGGYQVHDYHAIYESDAVLKAEKEARREKRREAGRKGGQASWTARSGIDRRAQASAQAKSDAIVEHSRSTCASAVVEPIGRGKGSEEDSSVFPEGGVGGGFRFDVAFLKLKGLYPPNRITSGPQTEEAFFTAIERAGGDPEAIFGRMLSNLATQKAGEQWQDKTLIPKLLNWIASGAWEQVHEPAQQRPVARGGAPSWNCYHRPRCDSAGQCAARTEQNFRRAES